MEIGSSTVTIASGFSCVATSGQPLVELLAAILFDVCKVSVALDRPYILGVVCDTRTHASDVSRVCSGRDAGCGYTL